MPSCRAITTASLAVCMLLGGAATHGQDPDPSREKLEARLDELERQLRSEQEANERLARELEIIQRRLFELDQADPTVAPSRDPFVDQGPGARSEGPTGWGGIFDKPFLRRTVSRTVVGGYMDLEYRDAQGSNRTFRQHRFVPFIYSQVTDQIRVAAEIEFEDGGTDSQDGGETKIEFATVDFVVSEKLGFRAGAILVPLGRFNLIHDSPVNDLTDRPLVDRFIVPTTLTESGAGFFGTLYPSEEGKLDYEIYLVNGFDGLQEDPASPTGFSSNFDNMTGLRAGRPSLSRNNNNSLSGVGRLAYSPWLGLDLAVSAHYGKYDDKGDNELFIYAFDAAFQPGRFWPALSGFEFLGEIARAEISRNSLARASGVPDDQWGAYGQVNYHFMPEFLVDKLPQIFRGESTFTAVTRFDHVELDDVRRQRITLGFNFRPLEDTVFKFDYQFNLEDWSRREERNDAVLLSVATYF